MLLYVHRDRTVAQDVHLDFHTAPELCAKDQGVCKFNSSSSSMNRLASDRFQCTYLSCYSTVIWPVTVQLSDRLQCSYLTGYSPVIWPVTVQLSDRLQCSYLTGYSTVV